METFHYVISHKRSLSKLQKKSGLFWHHQNIKKRCHQSILFINRVRFSALFISQKSWIIYWHMKSTMVSSSLEMNLVGETIHPEKDKKRIVTTCWNWTSRGKQLLQKINYQHVRYEGVWRKWVMTLNNAFKKEFCWRRI